MARPANFVRLKSYTRDAQNGYVGCQPDPAGLDAEFNGIAIELSQLRSVLFGVTNADGSLSNLGAATAMQLAGAQRFTATAAQTLFTTTITWSAAFTNLTCPVYASGVQIDPNAVTVANAGGFLTVTIPAQNTGIVVVVEAFAGTGGLQTLLLEYDTVSAGTDLVGVYDPGSLITATSLTGALQEIVTNLNTLTTGVGATAGLIRATGVVAMAANWSMGGFVINNLAPGVLSTDAVNVGQLAAYTAVWNALQSYFLKLDGSTAMAGSLDFGTNQGINVVAGVLSTDAVNVGQLVGYLDVAGVNAATANLNIGGFKITDMADGTNPTDAVTVEQLTAVSSSSSGFVNVNDYTVAGTTTLVLPAGVTKIKIRAWGGGGGGGPTDGFNGGPGGGAGGFVETFQTVTAGATLTIVVGAGGPSGNPGGNSTVNVGASNLATATAGAAGVAGFNPGVGGTGTFNGANGTAFNGSTGEYQAHGISAMGGRGGGAVQGGPGGQGGTLNSAPIAGYAPGGAGGGAGLGGTAGAGAAGRITIYY